MTPVEFDDINLLPDKDNENILRTISALGLSGKPFYVGIIPDRNADYGQCFVNVLKKVSTDGGEVVYGWQFAEYAYMIEAEFHAIWKAPDGNLIDITPGVDPVATKILFVVDLNRKFDGKRTDNFRYNTTDNPLVDDLIEIEKAKFRLTDNAKEVDADGRVIFSVDENVKWQQIDILSDVIDDMCRQRATVKSLCFCNSGLAYELCHRPALREFLATV